LSGRGLCDELITRPEQSYRLWRVVVLSINLVNEEALAHWGLSHQKQTNKQITFGDAFFVYSVFRPHVTSVRLGTNILLRTLFSETLNLRSSSDTTMFIQVQNNVLNHIVLHFTSHGHSTLLKIWLQAVVRNFDVRQV
jgi:hypothetical protein